MFAQNDTPLSIHSRTELLDDQPRVLAPSVFAAQAMLCVSSRYAFVPTAQLVSRLRDAGWAPVSGLLKDDVARRLERAGAVVTRLTDVGATLVFWPHDTPRRFMLEEVLLHEFGHHLLQHNKVTLWSRVSYGTPRHQFE